MKEKRAADRWRPPDESRGVVLYEGSRENARILDVSYSGMRVLFAKPVKPGAAIYAKVIIVENALPYYAVGEIKRVRETGDVWEASIQFSKIEQKPIFKDIAL